MDNTKNGLGHGFEHFLIESGWKCNDTRPLSTYSLPGREFQKDVAVLITQMITSQEFGRIYGIAFFDRANPRFIPFYRMPTENYPAFLRKLLCKKIPIIEAIA